MLLVGGGAQTVADDLKQFSNEGRYLINLERILGVLASERFRREEVRVIGGRGRQSFGMVHENSELDYWDVAETEKNWVVLATRRRSWRSWRERVAESGRVMRDSNAAAAAAAAGGGKENETDKKKRTWELLGSKCRCGWNCRIEFAKP